MWDIENKEDYANDNKENRIEAYKHLVLWAALAAVGPMGFFISNNILNAPDPISRTFTGYEREQFPLGDYYETYDYEYSDPNGGYLDLVGFLLGILAAVCVALLFYGIARFVADPIMYKIDLHTSFDSPVQLWSKRCIMGFVVLLFCATMVFAGEYDRYADGEYIWLSDGEGTEYLVNKEEYEKYMNGSPSESEKTEVTQETTTAPEPTEPSGTPVERGYPSNDLEYYIDHPNEPMPQELINELMGPDYTPGMDYYY